MTSTYPTLCASCVHLKKGGKCDAFPKGIPDSVLMFGQDHRSVIEGQVGSTVHVLKDGKEEDFEDWLDTYVFASD